MKIKINLFALVVLLSRCTQEQSGSSTLKVEYPDEIKKGNLTSQYDKAKWIYYESNFYNDTVWEKSQNPRKESYRKIVEFDLVPLEIKDNNDTLDVYFGIKDIDTLKFYTIAAHHRYCRIGISATSTNPIYRLGCSQAGITYSKPYPFNGGMFNKSDYADTTIARLKSYDLYPLDEQDELFKKYLVANQKLLCQWLKEEAIKRGVISK